MARKYVCKHCGKKFENVAVLPQHMEWAHGKKVRMEFLNNHFDTIEE